MTTSFRILAVFVRAIFDFGYEKAKPGMVWRKTPPYFDTIR
jgi:hypothetical protein